MTSPPPQEPTQAKLDADVPIAMAPVETLNQSRDVN